MHKRIFILSLFVIAFLSCFCMTAFCEKDVSLVIDNKKIETDVPPFILNDRTMVPARVFFENFDATVKWEGTLRQVIVTFKSDIMIFNIDSPIVYIDGITHTMDVSPVIIDDRTLLPVRFISEELGYGVEWNPESRTVYIKSPSEEEETVIESSLPKLSKIEVIEDKDIYKISVSLEKNITPKVMTLKEPARLIFDFYGVNQTCKDGNEKSYMSAIPETRWAEHEEFTRIVVECLEECKYDFAYSNGKYLITVKKPVPSEENGTQTQLPEIEISGDKPLVVLDAGHGGYDPGAVGRDDEGNIILYEKEVCLDIVKRVQSRLEAKGIATLLTRSSDVALGDTELNDLLSRTEMANNAKATLFISVHNNAFSNSNPSGTCVLYSGLTTNTDYGISGKDVAQTIQDYIVEATGLYDRGIVPRPNIVVLRETAMPAVLIEYGFITNPDDQQALKSNSKREAVADAICMGIIDSLKSMGKLK